MSAKIYRVRHSDIAQRIQVQPEYNERLQYTLENLRQLGPDTSVPHFRVSAPDSSASSFFYINDSVLVFTKDVYLGPMGEPLDFAGYVYDSKIIETDEEVYLLNVNAEYNCIDRARTVYRAPRNTTEIGVDHGIGIVRPAFFPNLIGDSSIFKIPQVRDAIYVIDAPEYADNFFTLYQESGLSDLRFEEVWSD